jgi:DnaJ-class molecular chaperone
MNPYEVLGVGEKATKDEIKKAFRALSMKWHPDKNKNDPAAMSKFQQINSAYEILSDDQKRNEHDLNADELFSQLFGNGFGPVGGMGGLGQMHMGGLGQMGGLGGLGQMRGMGQMGPTRIFVNGDPFSGGLDEMLFSAFAGFAPQPIDKQISISLVQAYNGASIPIEIERIVNNKRVEKETVYVAIAKGIDHGETIIIKEKGNVTNNRKGDIQILVSVVNDTKFERNGLDLITKQKITLKDALFGFVIDFAHINGKNYKLKNEGRVIQNQHKKTIAGLGLTRDGATGSLILIFEVETPMNLSAEKMELLREIL